MGTDDRQDLGNDAQRALLARGRAMFDLLGDDPGLTYYGRTVGLAAPDPEGLGRLVSLARLQGNGSCCNVPHSSVSTLRQQAEALGLGVVHYAIWAGGAPVVDAARKEVAGDGWPGDLSMVWLDAETPDDVLAAFGEMALGCGVLPPALDVLTGATRPGAALLAVEPSGRVVACAAAAAYYHPDHPQGATTCWWGMLATHPDRRGARLSLRLGAEVTLRMADRYGFSTFFTGVEPGNTPSEAICRRAALSETDTAVLGLADPALLPGGRMTK